MLIGITGKAGSGKDTFAKYFIDNHNFTRYAFAGPIKRMIQAGFGVDPGVWDDRTAKEQQLEWLGVSPRVLAQTLGTEWGRDVIHPDVWLLIAEQALGQHDNLIVTDVRFDNEAQWIKEHGGYMVSVEARGMALDNQTHASENGVHPAYIDITVRNTGTIEHLHTKASDVFMLFGPEYD